MHEQRIIDNRREAADAHTLIIEKPDGFTFEAGQYVLLQTRVDGRPLRRSYTIASAPHEQDIHITVRTQPHGRVSPTLAELEAGETIGVLGPVGEFTRTDEEHSVFVAAGAGITPFISMLRDAKKHGDTRRVTVLYTNKTPEQMLYREELESYAQEDWLELTQTITQPQDAQTPWNERTGRLTREDLKQLLSDDTVFYLCGSNAMVRAFTAYLTELEASPEQIRTENYGNVYA